MKLQQAILLEEVDWQFRKMVRRFVKERDKIDIEGVTLPQFMILGKLLQEGEQRMGELAEELDFTSGAITALCDKLVDGGYAIRKRSSEDRRTVMLDITEQGRAFLDNYAELKHICKATIFEGFTEEELHIQQQFYKRIIRNLPRMSIRMLSGAQEILKQKGDR